MIENIIKKIASFSEKKKIQRPFFKESSLDPIYYFLYEPSAIKVGNYLGLNTEITPNQITIFRSILFVITAFLLIYFVKNKFNKVLSIVIILSLLWVQWMLDDVDGYMARKFDMKSDLGAKLDFWLDIVCTIFFIGVLLYLLFPKIKYFILAVIFIIASLHIIHGKIIKMRSQIDNKDLVYSESYFTNIITHIHVIICVIVCAIIIF